MSFVSAVIVSISTDDSMECFQAWVNYHSGKFSSGAFEESFFFFFFNFILFLKLT